LLPIKLLPRLLFSKPDTDFPGGYDFITQSSDRRHPPNAVELPSARVVPRLVHRFALAPVARERGLGVAVGSRTALKDESERAAPLGPIKGRRHRVVARVARVLLVHNARHACQRLTHL
jgi:hypothetical protein